MKHSHWVLVETETTGFTAPITVVDLAAQRMRGWEPCGLAFRRLLNQNSDVSPEASRVHGYTREILERDGEPPAIVYRDFERYVEGLPIVSYNIEYDLEQVLKPEWQRLGIKPIGASGFCALRLAQRLLDPVPAGNCKLQTLRQYCRLPEHGGPHTALSDVQTVADLFSSVLRPIAEQRGLTSWEDICAYTTAEWFPSRIVFGKFKGRDFRDARSDPALRDWLAWLAESSNVRTACMGRWYLSKLEHQRGKAEDDGAITIGIDEGETQFSSTSAKHRPDLVIYVNPEIERLRQLIAAARARLAEVEAIYTMDRCAVDATQATIFRLVQKHYQARDNLRLIIEHRERYLKALIHGGEEEADEITRSYERAKAQSDADYKEAGGVAAKRKKLTSDEEKELRVLWKKLVLLFHPDRFANQQGKVETYQKLTGVINRAKEEGDIELLREIANDPHAFILRQGWNSLDFSDDYELKNLCKLLATLELEIINTMDALNQLRESSEYELYKLSAKQPGLLQKTADEQIASIAAEIIQLEAKAKRLKAEIVELNGTEPVW